MGDDTREMAPRPVDFSIQSAGKEIIRLKRQIKEKEQRLKDVERWCTEYLDDNDLGKLEIEDGPTLSLSKKPELIVWVLADDREKIKEWLQEIGEGAIVKEDWNYQTFRGVVRRRMEEGLKLHDKVNVTAKPKLNVRANGYEG